MDIHTFAAIYIGSYEVSLKIFELAVNSKNKEIDHVRYHIELGKDAYSNGNIGYELVEELCTKLNDFSKIMKGYKVTEYEIYASAVFREVKNVAFVLDQIFLRTGFSIKLINNSEHRFISYKSVAGRQKFEKMIQTSAAAIDVGGSGTQITQFKDGNLITTQHIGLGTMRIRNLLDNRSISFGSYVNQMEEYIEKKLETFASLYPRTVNHIIFMGDYAMNVIKKVEKNHKEGDVVKTKKFVDYISKLQKKTIEEISTELNLSNDSDPLILPAILLFKNIAVSIKAEDVWVPGVNINDGMAYDYAERNHLVKVTHDFEKDVISAANELSRRYNSYSPHIDALCTLSVKIFDTMKKIHGLSNRERLLLQVAAILHDSGKFISLINAPECAYHIIMSSEIMGLSHNERKIVALTVLYNSYQLNEFEYLRSKLDHKSYLTVAKLSAILRVANALDQSHKQKFTNIKTAIKGRELVITVESFEDISLEQTLFEDKTEYFENVFSLKPVLKEKRVYRV
ncbi:exopolyphosphatase / guanosine-5'-triphosphate,3'-diphosphate pyrophosphatase [Lachnospiraceae bacterium C7]|nr:exopolyphosphatase / guanosine-5'-triphosphate,3'-diphosphate pyrophosphatase [Lachnospiraceae bacterium C7]